MGTVVTDTVSSPPWTRTLNGRLVDVYGRCVYSPYLTTVPIRFDSLGLMETRQGDFGSWFDLINLI